MSNGSVQVRGIYRRLLRSTSQAVHHVKSDVQNLRRLLRDDVQRALDGDGKGIEDVADFEKRAANTILLHLSSNRRIEQVRQWQKENRQLGKRPLLSGKANRYAAKPHEGLLNLSDLCYFHLSPNTVMRSKKFADETNPVSLHQALARRIKEKQINQVLQEDQDEEGGQFDADRQPVQLLLLPARLHRGPKSSSIERKEKIAVASPQWDGQKSANFVKGYMPATDLEEMHRRYSAAADEAKKAKDQSQEKPSDTALVNRSEELYQLSRTLLGEYKVQKKAHDAQQSVQQIRSRNAAILSAVIRRSESRLGGVFLGSARMETWAKGEFLKP